nr:hypothetical protein [Candidatus Sigynarchaeum springense]
MFSWPVDQFTSRIVIEDGLLVNMDEARGLMCTSEANPVKEMLASKVVWFNPQSFWREIGRIARDYRVQTAPAILIPAKLTDPDLAYNLNRFGYREFGATIEKGKDACIELVVIALLLQAGARQREAAAVVRAKNTFKVNMLVFLSRKYNVAEHLLSVLKVLQHVKPMDQVQKAIDLLSALDVNEAIATATTDKESIIHALGTYHAT